MSTSGTTFEEMSESITGFDEIAVQKHFDFNLWTQGESNPVLLLRAMVFVHLRRPAGGSLTDIEARQRVLDMPAGEVQRYFEESHESGVDEPDTESGKDVSSPGSDPGHGLSSAS
ncbi:hypothetical protein GCM10023340_36400 [Nocardioides marinquilinus]|uniref:Uncharacterized protein n=1 Tax=Nocardioides marinquilinus TaxID=1210400 RepID=A0ABP9Q2Q3_9ACTN